MSKAFDADPIIAAAGGVGLIAKDMGGGEQVNVGGPTAAVYSHKLCFNWGEDPANGRAHLKYTCPSKSLLLI